jgi:WD40 repeat protein
MNHKGASRCGYFSVRVTTIAVVILTVLAVMPFMPIIQGTSFAASGDVILVTKGTGEARASNMTSDGRYIAFQSTETVPGLVNGGFMQILRKDLNTGDVIPVSSTAAGVQADSWCGHPSITSDARYVAFHSGATNLGGTGANMQVFRKDLQTGAVVLVSSDAAGVEGDSTSRRPRITDDGRYVVFESYATNLGGAGVNRHIFVKDLTTGTLVLASSDAAWAEGDAEAGHPYITPDGSYVSFHSSASNLVVAATGSDTQVFRKDLTTGAIVLVSSTLAGVEADDKAKYSYITPDGRYVSFYSEATNLDPAASGVDTQVFRKDLTTGAVTLVSKTTAGVEGDDDCGEWGANYMSNDGQYVCFVSAAINLGPATTGDEQVFRKDMTGGAVTLISSTSAGVEADGENWRASMTPDAYYYAFYSDANNLNPAAEYDTNQLYRKDITTGDVVLVSSVAANTVEGNNGSGASHMTSDGRYVAIQTSADNLLPDMTDYSQILRKDLNTDVYVLVSSDAAGVQGDDNSYHPFITPDARYIVFYSDASNLGGTGAHNQVYRKDFTTGAIVLVSKTSGDVEGDDDCEMPTVSDDGRYVTFETDSTNFGVPGGLFQIYRKDIQTGQLKLVSATQAGTAADNDCHHPYLTPDGRYVSFNSSATNLGGTGANNQVYRKDLNTDALALVSCNSGGTEGDGDAERSWMTPDGRYISFVSQATDLMSPATSGVNQVYRKDMSTGEVRMASSNASGTEGDNPTAEDQCPIGADGNYITFNSEATNLGPTTTGAEYQTFRKNMSTGEVVLASCGTSGAEADDNTGSPYMTSDGRYVSFNSDATNLGPFTTGEVDQIFRKELPVPTATPTNTPTPTPTPTSSVTPTPTVNPTPSITPPTSTPSASPPTSSTPTPTPYPTPEYLVLSSGDYTGDGISDIAIFRPSSGLWAVRGLGRTYFGTAGDVPVSGDYDGDDIADVSIFRPSSGLWAVKDTTRLYFGGADDIPVPGDYAGDGTCEFALFREDGGMWNVREVTRVYYGTSGDLPVPGDYDGDGVSNIAVFRASSGLWAIRGISRAYFGATGDRPVPGVYRWYSAREYAGGPFRNEIAIFRPSTGLWAIQGWTRYYFGASTDTPLLGDFTGGSLDNTGVFRPPTGLWAVRGKTRVYFGTTGDIPGTR